MGQDVSLRVEWGTAAPVQIDDAALLDDSPIPDDEDDDV